MSEVPTKTPTQTPTKNPEPGTAPERYYQPERLCPDQRQKGSWRARPRE